MIRSIAIYHFLKLPGINKLEKFREIDFIPKDGEIIYTQIYNSKG
jgi:hypothetical protein